jgi:hypothetical protein
MPNGKQGPITRRWKRKHLGPNDDVILRREWVQVCPHGELNRPEHPVGWIPRASLERIGVDCSPLDRRDSGGRQGAIFFTREQSAAIRDDHEFTVGDQPPGRDPITQEAS